MSEKINLADLYGSLESDILAASKIEEREAARKDRLNQHIAQIFELERKTDS